MTRPMLAMAAAVALAGCAQQAGLTADRAAVDGGRYDGLDKGTGQPVKSRAQAGRNAPIAQVHFEIDHGALEGKEASAILLRSRETGRWEVVTITVR